MGPVAEYTLRDVSSNHLIIASFTISGYTITSTAHSNGAINPEGAINVGAGDTTSFVITPLTGYHVDSVFVDGAYVGSPGI